MLLKFERNTTSTCIVMYSLYLYLFGLSLRNTSKILELFKDHKRSYVAVWKWIQRFGSLQFYNKRIRVSSFIIVETIIQSGKQHFWLWICIELLHRSGHGIYICKDRNTFVAENFIRSLVSKSAKHVVYTEGDTWYP
ncbi:MAG: hypothetical protein MRJ93_07310 [Nitrososphaeraceae archaeon]|nr:hypothetical protein [Nitrososphaeraceae archaeon]